MDLDIESVPVVIFSDHHRGARDGADDFLRCERAYNAALAYYLEQSYRLIALGDVEELWENDPEPVLGAYGETLELEAAFHREARYERIWGNHDDLWRYPKQVEKHLHAIFAGSRVREALKLRVSSDGEPLGTLFLVHGHQGTLESDRTAWFSRLVVRYIWRPLQRRLDIPSTSPARDWELRQRHEAAMFAWAREQDPGLVLIAGHTHRPVFWNSAPPPKIPRSPADVERELDEARRAGSPDRGRLGLLRAELEFIEAELRRSQSKAITIDPPCYFNTGCCSFGDGDVTGLEIADGEIRLVRWPDDEGRPMPKVLAKADLRAVLAAVRSPDQPLRAHG
ncbi:MAG: metallophosphoesterase family protein [Actinomycetota bacterium]|nr:metallophosphoesterase family protein [Actinomycetota bacterium]